jgi:CheY-like chemotaxis protein
MATTILLIHRQLAFAVSLKQSLERTGAYDVHPFTSASTAVEYLSTHPQDLAIVDFEMASATGDEIVVLLRDTQTDIPIIATPVIPESLVSALRLQGCMEARFSSQDILPLIEKILLSRRPGAIPLSGESDSSRSGLLTRVIEQKKTDVLPKTRERKREPLPEDSDLPPPPDPDMPATALSTSDFGWAENDDDQPGTDQLPLLGAEPPNRPRSSAPTNRLPSPPQAQIEFDWPGEDEDIAPSSPPDASVHSTQEFSGVNPSELFADFDQWSGPEEPTFTTSGDDQLGDFGDISFDALLAGLDQPEAPEPPQRDRFANLMDSMRPAEQERPPLPARQPYVELNLSSSMDSLLGEIERRRATAEEAPPPELPEDLTLQVEEEEEETRKRVTERLALEEPPQPGFEDSGTVGDLFTGVNDTSFQNVLSILRGEPTREEAPRPVDREDTEDFLAQIVAGIQQDDEDDYPADAPDPDSVAQRVEYDFDALPAIEDAAEPEQDTPARIILQNATSSTGDVSIDALLQSIEEQLPEHRPKVRPLPSWTEKEPKRRTSLFNRLGLKAEPPAMPDSLPEPVFVQPPAASADLTVPHAPPPPQPEAEVEVDFDALLEAQPADSGLTDLTVPHAPASAQSTLESQIDFDALFEAEYTPDGADEQDDAYDSYDQTTIAGASQPPIGESTFDETEMLPDPWAIDDDDWARLTAEFTAIDGTSEDGFATPASDVPDDGDSLLAYEAETLEPGQITPVMTTNLAAADLLPPKPAQPEPAASAPALPDTLPELQPVATPAQPAARLAAEEPPRMAGYDTEFDRMATFAFAPVSEEAVALDSTHIDDPYVAQLALNLTDVSLELTADGSLLSRGGEIIAYAGRMARAEMSELREILGNDWDARPEEARIRFVNLPASGKDYMVYTRRTVDDLSLTLIFSGETPLRDIRQQGKRLIAALRAVPEAAPPPKAVPEALIGADTTVGMAIETPLEPVQRTPFAYVWLLRAADSSLPTPTAQAIVSGLNVQLREQAWQVHDLRAADEYVYVLADVPGEEPPQHIARELKRRAGLIASAQNRAFSPDDMWAESYLVVTPGRPLQQDEIQQFIAFERMF